MSEDSPHPTLPKAVHTTRLNARTAPRVPARTEQHHLRDFRAQRWAHRSAILMLADITSGHIRHDIHATPPCPETGSDHTVYNCEIAINTHLPESTPALYHDALSLLSRSINRIASRHHGDTCAPYFCRSESGKTYMGSDGAIASYSHWHHIIFNDIFDIRDLQTFLREHTPEILAELRIRQSDTQRTSASLQ